jgi:predicted membrane protein
VLLWLQEDRSGLPIAAIQEESGKMPLVNLILVLIVVGVALWLINRYIPMASSIKTILNVVVVVAVGVWVLKAVGLWGSVSSFKVGQ